MCKLLVVCVRLSFVVWPPSVPLDGSNKQIYGDSYWIQFRMSDQVTVTNASAFEEKSLGMQVVLSIFTFGLYTVYWFYSTAKQLDNGTDASLTPIFAFLPFINILLMWQISSSAEAVTDQGKGALFVLFLFFGPLSWYWIQSGMNDQVAN